MLEAREAGITPQELADQYDLEIDTVYSILASERLYRDLYLKPTREITVYLKAKLATDKASKDIGEKRNARYKRFTKRPKRRAR